MEVVNQEKEIKMNEGIEKEISKSVEVILSGGTLLYPTDTIWGLGCDATNEEAVDQIYRIKQRTDSKSCLVLVDTIDNIYNYVKEVPEMVPEILELTENPLTIIYPGAINLASNLIAEDGSVGIRVTSDPFCQALIRKIRRPLVSTSANISGTPSPAHFGEVSEDIRFGVSYIVDHRRNERTPTRASGIIKLGLKGEVVVIRE